MINKFSHTVQNKKNCLLISAKKIESEVKKKKIEEKIQLLMTNLFRIMKNEKINELSYSVIYSQCYDICIDKGGNLILDEYNKNLENHLTELYQDNLNYLKVSESSFLIKMSSDYIEFINKLGIIQKTLLYHEKNYLLKRNLPNVKISSKEIYERIYLNSKTKDVIISYILTNVDCDRNSILINKFIIKDIINLLLDVSEDAYFTIVEPLLLLKTKEHYEKDFIKNIKIKNCKEYSHYVKNQLKDEENRINDLNLHKSRIKIMEIISSQLVEKLFNDENYVISHIINLLKFNDVQNIIVLKEISLFILEDRFIELLGLSIEMFGKQKIIDNHSVNYIETTNVDLIVDLMEFLDNLEQLKKDLNILSHTIHLKVLSNRISNIINIKDYPMLIAKLLSKNIDYTFTNFYKQKTSNDLITNYIDKVMTITKFIIDKDVFEINHRRLLSFRLLNSLYFEEIEMKFLARLKVENGAIYTHRCEVIITDVKQNSNMMEQYQSSKYYHKKYTKNSSEFNLDFNLKVLTQGNWIVNSSENVSIKDAIAYADSNINNTLSINFGFMKILDYFNQFFSSFYHNKVLQNNFFLGNLEVYCKFKNRNYFITMTPLQGFLCLLFNKHNKKINFSEIINFFKIKAIKSVINNILPLIKSGLINIDNEESLLEVLKSDKYESANIFLEVNVNFFNKQQRLKISKLRNDKIDKTEEKQSENIILERKYIIESNIIRIMKSKKSYSHNELLKEVVNSISSLFVPEINQIKQRIESLIERGYLTRSDSDFTTYYYTY